MIVYQVTLVGGEVLVTRQEETLEGVASEGVTDPVIFKKALEFALQEPSVRAGVRLLREGQVRVLESLRRAAQAPDPQEEQERWERACRLALAPQEEDPSAAEVVDLFAKAHHRQHHELLD